MHSRRFFPFSLPKLRLILEGLNPRTCLSHSSHSRHPRAWPTTMRHFMHNFLCRGGSWRAASCCCCSLYWCCLLLPLETDATSARATTQASTHCTKLLADDQGCSILRAAICMLWTTIRLGGNFESTGTSWQVISLNLCSDTIYVQFEIVDGSCLVRVFSRVTIMKFILCLASGNFIRLLTMIS